MVRARVVVLALAIGVMGAGATRGWAEGEPEAVERMRAEDQARMQAEEAKRRAQMEAESAAREAESAKQRADVVTQLEKIRGQLVEIDKRVATTKDELQKEMEGDQRAEVIAERKKEMAALAEQQKALAGVYSDLARKEDALQQGHGRGRSIRRLADEDVAGREKRAELVQREKKLAALSEQVAALQKELAAAEREKGGLDTVAGIKDLLAQAIAAQAACAAEVAKLREATGGAAKDARPTTAQEMAEAMKGKEVVAVTFVGPEEKLDAAVAGAKQDEVIGAWEVRAIPKGWTLKPVDEVAAKDGVVSISQLSRLPGKDPRRAARLVLGVQVSEAGIKRALAMHEVMARHGFGVEQVKVWQGPGDEALRAEARKLVAGVLADFGWALEEAMAGSKTDAGKDLAGAWLGETRFELPDGKTGLVRVTQVSPLLAWRVHGELEPERWVHFEKLGLVVSCHRYDGKGSLSAEDSAAVGKAFGEAIVPLMKRERAEVREGGWGR